MNVDCDVRLFHLKALKELNYGTFVGCPWKSPDFNATINIIFVDSVTTSDVFVFRVEGLELGMVFDVEIAEEDPAAANLLLLLFFESPFSVLSGLEQNCSLACLSAFFVHLILQRVWYHIIAFEKCSDVFISSFERQSLKSQRSLLFRARVSTGISAYCNLASIE